jgi:cytoplasmic iron level regulating protein YaaA (DUF328/UPF0246 family)
VKWTCPKNEILVSQNHESAGLNQYRFTVRILLPPSEGKSPGGTGRWRPTSGTFGRQLAPYRSLIATALQSTPAKSLKVQGATANHALAVNADLLRSTPSLPAYARYSGVVSTGMAIEDFSPVERDVAMNSVVYASGLLGLVGFDDPTPDYRASMDASLPSIGPLAQFWHARLVDACTTFDADELVLDLLTTTLRRAVISPSDSWHVIDLVHPTIVGGHAAKFVKGELARWLLTHDVALIGRWRRGEWRARIRER